MARIPIFDSAASVNSSDVAIDHALEQNVWKTSEPVRLHGGEQGDQRNISYEFILGGSSASSWIINWYQEFYPDEPHTYGNKVLDGPMLSGDMGPTPGKRTHPWAVASEGWAREMSAVHAAGTITQYNITRAITMTNGGDPETADNDYYPMLVHGYWVRLKIVTTSITADVVLPTLRVYALIGGHTDFGHYTERLSVPFSYEIPEE